MLLSKPETPEGHRVTSLSLFYTCEDTKIFDNLKDISNNEVFEKVGSKFFPKSGSLAKRQQIWQRFYEKEFGSITGYQWNFTSRVPVSKKSTKVSSIKTPDSKDQTKSTNSSSGSKSRSPSKDSSSKQEKSNPESIIDNIIDSLKSLKLHL